MTMSVSSVFLVISYLIFAFFCSASFFTTTVDGRRMIATMVVHHQNATRRGRGQGGRNGDSTFGHRRDDGHSDYYSDWQARGASARGGNNRDRNSPSVFGLPHPHQRTQTFGQGVVAPERGATRYYDAAAVDLRRATSANRSKVLEGTGPQPRQGSAARSASEGRRGSQRRDSSPPNPRDAVLDLGGAGSAPMRRSLSMDSMPAIDERQQSVHDVKEHIARHNTMDLGDVELQMGETWSIDNNADPDAAKIDETWSVDNNHAGPDAAKPARRWFCGPCGASSSVMDD